MPVGNAVVGAILRSPLHRLLSRSTCLVRYTGRRSGRQITTPTQYTRHDDGVVILVGRHKTKRWWRNFREPRELEVLIEHVWRPMTGTAILGAEDPARLRPLLDAYLARFPKAVSALSGDDADGLDRSYDRIA